MPKSLRARLSDANSFASKAERMLANYMLAELATLPFETAASLAKKVAVSEPTVGRFCRTLGYKGFKDFKSHLRLDMGDQPWLIGDRLSDLRARNLAGENQLVRGLELEMAALVAVYEIANSPGWESAVKRLATAKMVFATGFQTERGMAQIFVSQSIAVSARRGRAFGPCRRQLCPIAGARQPGCNAGYLRGAPVFATGA